MLSTLIFPDESTYAEYDEKMTSYDLGVAPSFSYGGYAWMDIQYDAEGQPKSDSINGQMDDAEQNIIFTRTIYLDRCSGNTKTSGSQSVEKDGRYLVINENSGKISVDSMGSHLYETDNFVFDARK